MTEPLCEKHFCGNDGFTKQEADLASVSTLSILDDDDDYMWPISPCVARHWDDFAPESDPWSEAAEWETAQAQEQFVQTTCCHVQHWYATYSEVTSRPCDVPPPPPPPPAPSAATREASAPKADEQGTSAEASVMPCCKTQSMRWADEEITEGPSDAEEFGSATLMVRNIACRYSKEDVVGFLADLGFQGTYDFFYLPMNATQRANLGYFFINFTNEADSDRCRESLQGKCLGTSQTQKRCDVSLARVQGSKSISKHFHRKAVTRSAHAPMFLGKEQ